MTLQEAAPLYTGDTFTHAQHNAYSSAEPPMCIQVRKLRLRQTGGSHWLICSNQGHTQFLTQTPGPGHIPQEGAWGWELP